MASAWCCAVADALSESEIDDAPDAGDSKRLQEVWERAMERFDAVAVPQQELRAQSLEARRFVTIPGAQWEGAWGEQFENSPRPEVDKITKSLEKIETDYRENRLTVDFIPAGSAADEDTADTLDGMHRADSYHFKAQQARDNAFQEAIRGGFGAYRLTTDYADPYDRDNDSQRINPGMAIVDADQSVYFYGGVLYDKSDAEAAFILTRDLRGIAEKQWGADNLVPWPNENWKWVWDWYTPDVVCKAEYFEVEEATDKLLIFELELTGEEQRFFESEIQSEAIRELTGKGWMRRSRSIKRRRIHKYILNGTKVLKDCGYVAGDNIPIVPVYGRRDWVDNMERWRGHVTKKMDRQRIYNTRVAKLVEQDSLAPRELPIFDPEQIDPAMADEWARANIDRLPFLRAHALRDSNGDIKHIGPIGKVEPPQVQQATASLLQIAATDLTDEDDNADEVKANVSADAMDIAASRVDAKSAIYLDNMRQSIQREAEIYLGMAREVYYEPGREVETLSIDGKNGLATLGENFIDQNKVYRVRNDLARGTYKVVADVQESTVTKRQKTVKQNMEIAQIASGLQSTQDLAAAALLNAVMNQDGEGMQDMQAFARRKLIALGVVEPTPEEQAQIQAAQEGQQPSAADQALQAQAAELASKVQVNEAKAVQTLADAELKQAQAQAVGGPASAPDTPSGLHPVEVEERQASAELKRAQAEEIRRGGGEKQIRMGHELEMGRRQQELAEREPKEKAA